MTCLRMSLDAICDVCLVKQESREVESCLFRPDILVCSVMRKERRQGPESRQRHASEAGAR